MVDFQNVVFQRVYGNCGDLVLFAVEFEFFPSAKTLPLIPPKRIRDVYQFAAIITHTAIFEFTERFFAETWRKMKRDEEEEEGTFSGF